MYIIVASVKDGGLVNLAFGQTNSLLMHFVFCHRVHLIPSAPEVDPHFFVPISSLFPV